MLPTNAMSPMMTRAKSNATDDWKTIGSRETPGAEAVFGVEKFDALPT